MAGIGTGIGGIASSATYYNQLSTELTNDIEQVAKSIMTIQDQLDSLASVVLQNWRGLDLLTAKNGGLCLFLNEECCFYVNQLGIVRDMAQQLQDRVTHRRQDLANSWNRWNNIWHGHRGLFHYLAPSSCFYWHWCLVHVFLTP
jgi:hypothetical protein